MSEKTGPISYQRCRVSATYDDSGPVDYDGFMANIAGTDYLLHWENTIVWHFEDSKYDHVEIALDSLKQLAQLKTQLAHKPAAAANSPLQAWAIFLDDFGQTLADNLAEEGFANYWRARPDSATYECYVTAAARVGQKLLEDWLK